ncbi:MAG: hypothetical protein CMJ18_00345 [Phycisphaeraceae bacterium]|nr:hypothetical protein [Phycisphaeraceae bacterium]
MHYRPLIIVAVLVGSLVSERAAATEFWVAPDGDDRASGTSRDQAWSSPSRGQPTRVRDGCKAGQTRLSVLSTEGFLDAGTLDVGGVQRRYTSRTTDGFELAEPFDRDLAALEFVNDASILGGDSFEPGDVIHLAGGRYVDKPLRFCRSGAEGAPITYRSAPGERAVLLSTTHNVAPVQRLGSWRKDKTAHVVFKDLRIENHTEGMHCAPGMSLYGISAIHIDGCDIDISGRDVKGDNNAISMFGADRVRIERCRLRSRQANGLMIWQASNVLVADSVIYESFNGLLVAGGRFPARVKVRNCTFYAVNTYGAVNVESPGNADVENCIIAQMPTALTPALRGPGQGDYNCLWQVPVSYERRWNRKGEDSVQSDAAGVPGGHDVAVDPHFISLNPESDYFLRIPHDSPVARSGREGVHLGAFAPVQRPTTPKFADFDVRTFGAVGDGATDDLPAIRKAIAQAVAAGGGRVVFPASPAPYLVSDTIQVTSDHVQLIGNGATLKLKPGAGRMDLIVVGRRVDGVRSGPVPPGVEHIRVEGFTLDGSYRSQPQKRVGNNPRGIWVGNARHVVVKDLTIRDTFCGLTFGPGARDSQAVDVTVTDWDHDAYGASGRGLSGSCTDIRFLRCRAVNTPKCIKAWEIEEGAHRVLLEDCVIDNLGGAGTGYYVRHHEYQWPVLVHDVTLRRCRVSNISGQGFVLTTVPGTGPRSVRPTVRTQKVRLIDCTSDAPVTIAAGIDDVVVEGGRFADLVTIGFDATKPNEDRGPRWPARAVTIRDSTIDRLRINARTGNPNAKLGDKHWPDYEPRVALENVAIRQPVQIVGPRERVRITSKGKQAMPGPSDDGQIQLVTGGKATSTIVVADDADWWHRMAAGWLQEYVQRATGANLPIVRESEAPEGTLISVGHTRRAQEAGIRTDDLKWDGCRLVVREDVLFLIGRDGEGPGRGDPSPKQLKDYYEGDPWRPDRIAAAKGADLAGANGTCKAVVTFLEQICGVRWFMPFEQGIVVPRRDDVTVTRGMNKVVQPVFAYANGSFLYGTPRLYPSAYANNFRFGIRLKTYGGHAWNAWVPKSMFKRHPEYFALRDGKRNPQDNHLCTTNIEVRDRLLKEIRELFDQGYDWVQLGQSDGWKRCECDACEAMDNFKPYDAAVDGPDWYKWLHNTNRRNPVDRIHVLHNWIAEQVAVSHPGKKVHYLAYIPTRWPSLKVDYSPNIVAELCHEIPEMLEAWSDKVTSMTVYRIWWDMSWVYGYGPDPTFKEVADEIRDLRDNGVIGLFNGGEGNCWGLNGPVFYVMGRLMGDPDLDENEVVREYCHGVYGEAGAPMNDFFQVLYKGPARKNKPLPGAPHGEHLRARFPPRVIAELEEQMKKAEAVGVTGHAADNLRMTRIGMDYLRLTTHMWLAYETFQVMPSLESLAELRKHVDAFEDFRHEILHMDPDDAERRYPDWGHFCKWLTGSHYWHSWYQVKDKVDIDSIRGRPVGFYTKIRKPLTLNFDELEAELRKGAKLDADYLDEMEEGEAEKLAVALRVEDHVPD